MSRVPCLFVGSISLSGFEDGDNGGNPEQVSRDVELSVSMLRGVTAVATDGEVLFSRPILEITDSKVCPTSRHICCFVTTEAGGHENMHAFQFESVERAADVDKLVAAAKNAASKRDQGRVNKENGQPRAPSAGASVKRKSSGGRRREKLKEEAIPSGHLQRRNARRSSQDLLDTTPRKKPSPANSPKSNKSRGGARPSSHASPRRGAPQRRGSSVAPPSQSTRRKSGTREPTIRRKSSDAALPTASRRKSSDTIKTRRKSTTAADGGAKGAGEGGKRSSGRGGKGKVAVEHRGVQAGGEIAHETASTQADLPLVPHTGHSRDGEASCDTSISADNHSCIISSSITDDSMSTALSATCASESESKETAELHRIALRLTLAVLSDDLPGARELARKLADLERDREGESSTGGRRGGVSRETDEITLALEALEQETPTRAHERLAAVLGAVVLKADAQSQHTGDDLDEDEMGMVDFSMTTTSSTSSELDTHSRSNASTVSTIRDPNRLTSPPPAGGQSYARELNLEARRQMSTVSVRGGRPSSAVRERLAAEAAEEGSTPTPHDESLMAESLADTTFDLAITNLNDSLNDTICLDSLDQLRFGEVKGLHVVIAGSPDKLLKRAVLALREVHGEGPVSLVDRARAIDKAVTQSTDLLLGVRQFTDPDHVFLDSFFLAFRVYYSPEQLAEQLFELHAEGGPDARAGTLATATHWVTHYWCDFVESPALVDRLELLHRTALAAISAVSAANDFASGATLEQVERCHALAHAIRMQQSQPTPRKRRPSDAFGPTENVVARLQPRSIAEQLTLLNHALIAQIHPVEYVLYYFPGEGQRPADVAPRLEEAIKRFDAESYWVAAEILFPPKSKDRAALVTKFIKVAQHCLKLGNFFSLFSILGALCFPEITRLRSVWEKVGEKHKRIQSELEAVMNPSRNMKAYRDRLRSFDSAPRVPFLPLHLKDLVFANEAGKTWRKHRVNFEKLILIARCVLPVTSPTAYRELEMDHALQTYFRVSVVPNLKGWADSAKAAADGSPQKQAKGSTMAAMRQAIRDSFLRSRGTPPSNAAGGGGGSGGGSGTNVTGSTRSRVLSPANDKPQKQPRKSFWRDKRRGSASASSTSSKSSSEEASTLASGPRLSIVAEQSETENDDPQRRGSKHALPPSTTASATIARNNRRPSRAWDGTTLSPTLSKRPPSFPELENQENQNNRERNPKFMNVSHKGLKPQPKGSRPPPPFPTATARQPPPFPSGSDANGTLRSHRSSGSTLTEASGASSAPRYRRMSAVGGAVV
eukprot:m.170614 g.170614  ORF g.170614 m.170614 type:complete len:1285 (+) comp14798_c0_seq1:1003-4857(+)